MLATLTLSAPIIIAHRGASGERPEHTLEAYTLAIEQKSDFIEPDLVMTKDGVLIARHENEISSTTDIGTRPEFAARKTTKTIDGARVTGWFTEDLTLAEIKTLRAKERLPLVRPKNTAFDGKFLVPTLAEVVTLARRRGVGIYPEIKHPAYFRSIGLPMEEALVKGLSGLPRDKVFIQCFEVGPLERLNALTDLPLIQLIDAGEGPWDRPNLKPQAMVSDEGLAAIRRYADGVGLNKNLVIARTAEGNLGTSTGAVARAKAAGLKVHVWTFRDEAMFLPRDLQGKPEEEFRRFAAEGIDGVFVDSPATAVRALRP